MKLMRMIIGVNALLLLLLMGGACATSTQSAAKSQEPLALPDPANVASPPPPSDHADEHAQEDKVPRIKPVDAVKLVKEGKAILIDVRDIGSYENMHAKGAIHVSYQDIQEGKFDKLPKGKSLIFYCT